MGTHFHKLPAIITDILSDAPGPFDAREIARRITPHPQWELKHLEVPLGIVTELLETSLQHRVRSVAGGWVLKQELDQEADLPPESRTSAYDGTSPPMPSPTNGSQPASPRPSTYPSIERSIVQALRSASAPMKDTVLTAEIAQQRGVKHIDDIARLLGQIRRTLKGSLASVVVEESPRRWRLRSSDSAPHSKTTSPPPARDTSPASPQATPDPRELLVREIQGILAEANEPLPTDEIVWAVAKRNGSADAEAIRHALRNGLDERVEQTDGGLWQLRHHSASTTAASPPTPIGEPPDENTPAPLAAVARIGRTLEHARLVTSALALAGEPLDAATLAQRLRASDVPISKREVETCLQTTLSAWAVEDIDGRWQLTDHPQVRPEPAAPESNDTPPEQTSPDAPAAPQAGVRATVVSRSSAFRFAVTSADDPALFSVRAAGADLEIVLNQEHPAFEMLTATPCEKTALLLTAWARLESDLPGVRLERAAELRQEWGRVLRALVRDQQAGPADA